MQYTFSVDHSQPPNQWACETRQEHSQHRIPPLSSAVLALQTDRLTGRITCRCLSRPSWSPTGMEFLVIGLPCQWIRNTNRPLNPSLQGGLHDCQLVQVDYLEMRRYGLCRNIRVQCPQFTHLASSHIVAPKNCQCLHGTELRWRAPPRLTHDAYREFQATGIFHQIDCPIADL